MEEPLGDAEGDVLDEAEAVDEGTDGVGGVDREGALEDVEPDGARVEEHHARDVGPVGVDDHVRQHLVLQPREDAVLAWVWGAVGPVVPRGAAEGLVEVQGPAGRSDHGGDVAAVLGGEGGLVKVGVLVEGKEVVVDVAAREGWRGQSSCMWGWGIYGHLVGLPTGGEPGDGHEADGLHVATAFQPVGFAIVFGVVADVGVAAEELDGDVPLLCSDCLEDAGELLGAQRDMTDDEEKVYLSVSYGFLEPLLLDGVLDSLDDGVVRVVLKVEKEAKSEDADALVLRGEFLESLGQGPLFPGLGIDDV